MHMHLRTQAADATPLLLLTGVLHDWLGVGLALVQLQPRLSHTRLLHTGQYSRAGRGKWAGQEGLAWPL